MDALLNEMRVLGDPETDRLMSNIFASGEATLSVPEMLKHPWSGEYFAQHSRLPDWADPTKIEQGQELFYRYGMTIVTLLFFSALPEGYACRKPAEVLVRTGNMVDGRSILQRILRTAQFLIDVMMPANLTENGAGVRSAVQLRLLHSAVRTRLGCEDWAADRVLINQEELAGTLGTFSVLMLEGMQDFEIDFTPDEIDAYLHVWNVVGYLMGIDERLLQARFEDASLQFHTIKVRIQSPCQEGRALTKALLDFLHEMIPGEALDGLADTLMRHTVGEKLAADLSIPECDWTGCFIPILKRIGCWTDQAGDSSLTVRKGLEKMQTKLIEGLMGYYSAEAFQVRVPDGLRSRWGLGAETA
ncbi:MAG: DUF2236 domain-containing protein [bacterium]|nr:DUF2236 domain-containing protein [bacterium]